jgi:hypothetical protein
MLVIDIVYKMKVINTPGQAWTQEALPPFPTTGGGVFQLAFPALARDWNHQDASPPLVLLGNIRREIWQEKR